MDKSNLARTSTYSPTDPESGKFVAAPRVTPVDSREIVGHQTPAEDSRDGEASAARLALMEALCVLARAAARLSHGGVR